MNWQMSSKVMNGLIPVTNYIMHVPEMRWKTTFTNMKQWGKTRGRWFFNKKWNQIELLSTFSSD